MNDVAEKIEITVDVDLDKSVECEIYSDGIMCSAEATWIGTAMPCGHHGLMCDIHHETSLGILRNLESKNLPPLCDDGGADHVIDTVKWSRL